MDWLWTFEFFFHPTIPLIERLETGELIAPERKICV
jgi:hypothetical protein